MKPLISVVIPAYNHTAELKRSLLSLSNQTYDNLEIIIVDDGNTKPLFSKKYKVIRQVHSGAPAARNRGFKESRGEFIIFWDADTVANPTMLERLTNVLNEHPEASYAYSQFRFGWKVMRSRSFDVGFLKHNNYIDTTSLIRRSALPDVPFDTNLKRFQDWDLWLTLLEKNKTGHFVPEVLYTKIVGFRRGISKWLPRFVYWFGGTKVKEFDAAKKIVMTKHGLIKRPSK